MSVLVLKSFLTPEEERSMTVGGHNEDYCTFNLTQLHRFLAVWNSQRTS